MVHAGDTAPSSVKLTVVDLPTTRRTPPLSTLPVALTSFIGRTAELDQLRVLLLDQSVRMLTLTGPGGVGKTRLALRVARDIESSAAMGVDFVALAPLGDPRQVAPAIGQAYDLSNIDAESLPERLLFQLKDAPQLLILDNFEHVIEAAPIVSELVASCPSLTILSTSRVRLRLSGEEEYQVQPLSQGLDDSAIDLFLDRADMHRESLTEHDLTAIAAICGKLDGIPLAIELAAAKSRLLSPAELAERLDHALPILTDSPRDAPERHRTMRGAIAWSYDLLSPSEQALFRMLSVFSGGFTVADVEGIAPVDTVPDVLAALQSLLDHSLIRRLETASGPPRFTMLETIRQFGNERLLECGNESEVRDRHAAWFAGLLGLPEPKELMEASYRKFSLAGEQDNCRTALRWSIAQGDSLRAANLALNLSLYCWQEGFFSEAREALAQVLAMPGPLPAATLVGLLGIAAEFAMQQSDFDLCRALATDALQIARNLGDIDRIHWHLRQISWVAMVFDPPSAIAPIEEIVALCRAQRDAKAVAHALHMLIMTKVYADRLSEALAHLEEARAIVDSQESVDLALEAEINQLRGTLMHYSGRHAEALPYLHKGLALRRKQGNKVYEFHCLRDLGRAALELGDAKTAASFFSQALELAYLVGSEHGKTFCFVEIASVSNNAVAAAMLLGAEARLQRQLRLSNIPTERNLRDRTTRLTRSKLGDARFDDAFEAGKSLTSMEVYKIARNALSTALNEPQMTDSLLTPREREVLILISEGKSDREIGDALFVSRRTAATHVRNLFAKLDVHSRAEAAAWAVRNEIA